DKKDSGIGAIDGNYLESVMDSIRDSIKIVDRSFNVIFANKAGLENAWTDQPRKKKGALKCFEKFYHNSEQCSFCVIDRVFNSGMPAFNVFHSKNGGDASVKEISAFPLTGKSGKVEHVIEIVRDVTELKKDLVESEEFSEIISQDSSMENVFDIIKSVAATNSTVLISGETGTGKELIARAIHKSSRRRDKKLVTMNCGAFPETLLETELFGHEKGAFTGADQRRIGRFETAHQGTLFLDEIGTISQSMQVKILRVLQEGELTRVGGNETIKVDIRYVCATNVNLQSEVKAGNFREDLYYRINVVPIMLPPLRKRGDDIKLLAEHFLEKFSGEIGKRFQGFTGSALERAKQYAWPGNIRELRNLVERAVILSKGKSIERLDIPETDERAPVQTATFKDVVETAEKEYLIKALKNNRGSISQTAEKAGVNARTIHRKMKDYGIDKDEFK
ncbi:Two-component system response regulator protein, partial [hydrothermal vent metagenome]